MDKETTNNAEVEEKNTDISSENAPETKAEKEIETSNDAQVVQSADADNTQANEQTAEPATEESKEPQMSEPLESYPILVIDDDRWIQRIFNQYLNAWGFKHLQAMDAFSGVNLAFQNKPLIIFLDIVMPDVPGDVALKFIKAVEHVKDAPVVIISGNLNKQILKTTYKDGAIGFISKPFSREILFDKIKEVLDPAVYKRMVHDGILDPPVPKKKIHLPTV